MYIDIHTCMVESLGVGFQGSGLGVWAALFRVRGLRLGFWIQGLGLRIEGLGFRVQGLGLRVQGSGFRV